MVRVRGVQARGAAAGGGHQRVLGGPVGLPPAPRLAGQLAGLRRGLLGHPGDLVRGGTAERGPAHHDLPRVQRGGQVVAGQPERPSDHLGGRRVQQRAVDVAAAQARRAGLPDRVADHPVRAAVVDPAGLHDVLGEVGGLRESRLERGSHPGRVHLQGAHHAAGEPRGPQRQVQRAGHLAVGEDEVVAAGRRGLGHRQQPGQPADQGAGRAPDDGQRIRVPLLRHEHAGPAVAVGQGDVVELLTGPDLQVLGQLGLGQGQARGRADHVEQAVDLPHRVTGVLGDGAEAQQGGDVPPVGAQPGAVHAARSARAGVGPRQRLAQPATLAQHRERERQDVVAERRRLCMLQVRLVGHQRARVLTGPARELGRQRGGRLDEVGQVAAQPQPEGDPDRLPPRAPRVQPARHVPDPADEVPLPRVVRLAVGRIVGEVAGRDRDDLEQEREQPAGRVGRDDPGRGQVEQVGQVGQVHAVMQDRGIGILQLEPGLDQFRGGRADRRPGREPGSAQRLVGRGP